MLTAKNLAHAFGQFDNHAADYQHITAKPLAAAMGAEILGVDCANVTVPAQDDFFQGSAAYGPCRPIGL
jgi:hypothetical protein